MVPDDVLDAARRVNDSQAYATGWGDFTTTDFREVTGRPPRSIAGFARDHADVFTSTSSITPSH